MNIARHLDGVYRLVPDENALEFERRWITWSQLTAVIDAINAALDAAGVGKDAGVLILTDMFGGTPSNLAMSFLAQGNVEVITGVNLPMLIKLASLSAHSDLLAAAREIREQGRNAIWVASDLLRGEKIS